jgi:hypothetical protein
MLERICAATKRWPALGRARAVHSRVALWWPSPPPAIFPRAFFPGPLDVVRSFFTLTYKGILPDYLQDSVIRLAVGAAAAWRSAYRSAPDRPADGRIAASVAAAVVLPGDRRHRLAADPADLVRLRPCRP